MSDKKGLYWKLVSLSKEAAAKAKAIMAANTLRRTGQSAESDAADKIIDAKVSRIKMLEELTKDPAKAVENFNWTEYARLQFQIERLSDTREYIRRAYVEMFGDVDGLTPLDIVNVEFELEEE